MSTLDLNPVTVSAVSSLAMAGIWIVYLHIAIRQYKRAKLPRLVIHHAHDNDPDALCLFVNMSAEPVHISCVMINVYNRDERLLQYYITDYKRITPDDEMVLERLRQGPVGAGGFLILGSFREIIGGQQNDSRGTEDRLRDIRSVEICVAAVHGASKYHVGARRRFFIEDRGDRHIIRAYNIHTEQLVTLRKQKTVRRWIEGHLEPRHVGESESASTQQEQEKNG